MSGIKWLTCPKCEFRFYIVEEHADQGFEWFCPRCKTTFSEAEDEAAHKVKVHRTA
jgi:uncharacterized paraquat-inducible protein A